jgi:hypothetical protein
MEEIQLKVDKAYPIDLGRGIVRLDPTTLLKLQLSPDDIVEIRGKKKTTAKVWRADRQDWDQGLAKIDNFIRQNAGVSIGEKVAIKKVEAPEAKKLILALPESMKQGRPELQFGQHANEIIKPHILKRPVFRGDIVPIINSIAESSSEFKTKSTSEYLTEDQNSIIVIPLVVIDTEPSDSIVQVFEETTIELSDEVEVYQSSEVTTSLPFNYKESSNALSHSIAVTTEPTNLHHTMKDNKRIKTKEHYDIIVKNIIELNNEYEVEDNTVLLILDRVLTDRVLTESDKTGYDFADAFNYINELNSKIEIIYRVALSEVVHRKRKVVDLQRNLFFSSRPPNYSESGNNKLDKFDDTLQGTKDIKKCIVKSKKEIKKLQKTEAYLVEEQKTGIRDALKTIIFWGIPLLFNFYSLVAVGYFTVDFYTPITFYIFLSCVTYFLLKSGVNLKIIHLAYKNNIFKFKKLELLSYIPILTIVFMGLMSIIKEPPKFNDSKISLFGYFLIILGFVFFMILLSISLKDSAEEAKLALIKKEVDNLIEKYDINNLMRR